MAKTKKLGDLVNQTISTTAPLSGGANLTDTLNFSITKANTTTDGYVSKEDWNIFNNKQDSLGFTPYNATNPDGYISGITSGMVTTALGFTPYNATNPDGYITSSALTPYAPLSNPTFTTAITTPIINGVSGNLAFNNAVQTSGAITAFTFTKPNNTTQTASTQINGFVVNGGTRQWLPGNITTQSENVWGATTYSFATTPSTITNAYGNVFNAPVAGTNCTITNNFAAQFNGQVQINGSISNSGGSPNLGTSGAPYGTFFITNIRGGSDLSFGSGFSSSGDKGLVMFSSTRNILISNGGTFTDNGFRLDVNGTARFQGNVSLTQTVTTETLVQTRTVTIVINGTTYKLLAA